MAGFRKWIALACCSIAISANAAPIRVLGIDSGTIWDYSNIEQGKVSNVTFTEVSTAAFAAVNLNNYDVLVVSETFTDNFVTTVATATLAALKAREAQIASWVSAGHGLVVLSEPIGAGRWDWLPDAIQPVVGGPLIHDDTVRIVNSLHPVAAGLSNAGLSGWGTSSHGEALTSPLGVIVDDGAGRAITLAGNYGAGRVVLTLQDPDFHNYYGNVKPDQARFMQNAIHWASVADQVVPEPAGMALVLAGLAGIGLARRKRPAATK